MIPMGESYGELFFRNGDSAMTRLCDVREFLQDNDSAVYDVPYASLSSDDMSFTCTLSFVMKHVKGYLDHISGKTTPAARRFLRASKRWKEKQRRLKLKGVVKQ